MTSPTHQAALASLPRRALALSLGPAVALGLARFGYALLLPAMRTDLAWTYAQAGSMNTANALGYLVGALVTAPLTRRFGTRRTFVVAFLLTALSVLGSGLTANFTALLVLRFLAGFGGAGTFVGGAALAAHLAGEREGQGGLVLGLYFGGVGIGILITGLGLPLLLDAHVEAWRQAWVGMGALALLALWPARRAARTLPEPPPKTQEGDARLFQTALLPSLAAYFLFGLGYITYMTFVIAFLRAGGVGPWSTSAFWLVLGASTSASAFVWSGLLDRARGGRALALLLLVVAAGSALPLLSTSLAGVLLSGVLFGGAFLSVVSAVTDIVRRGLPAHAWAGGIAFFTVVFSVGQTLGPLLSGALADRTGALGSGFALSAALLLAGAVAAAFQPTVRHSGPAGEELEPDLS